MEVTLEQLKKAWQEFNKFGSKGEPKSRNPELAAIEREKGEYVAIKASIDKRREDITFDEIAKKGGESGTSRVVNTEIGAYGLRVSDKKRPEVGGKFNSAECDIDIYFKGKDAVSHSRFDLTDPRLRFLVKKIDDYCVEHGYVADQRYGRQYVHAAMEHYLRNYGGLKRADEKNREQDLEALFQDLKFAIGKAGSEKMV